MQCRDRLSLCAAPVLTSLGTVNGPTTGGSTLTVSGMNFGTADMSPTLSIGAAQCTTSSWMSATSMVCRLTGGGGEQATATAIVASLTSTFLAYSFTYDSALAAASAVANLFSR